MDPEIFDRDADRFCLVDLDAAMLVWETMVVAFGGVVE